MRATLADALGVDQRAVNIKATTTEGLGFIGAGDGMAAMLHRHDSIDNRDPG